MKSKKRWFVTALTACLTLSLGICVEALEYDFNGVEDTEYYPSTSYESLYGAKYNYGGSNATDYQWPALPYGVSSNTSVGCMEKVRFPGLVGSIGGSGIESNITNPIQQEPQIPSTSYQPSAYTSVDGMERKDGSIGTLKIPSLNINMKVWEGETNTSMAKGLGHYSSTSGWDGNIGVCGHNRGAKYTIGNIKNLKDGDTITYTTVYGTRTYGKRTVDPRYLEAIDVMLELSGCDPSFFSSERLESPFLLRFTGSGEELSYLFTVAWMDTPERIHATSRMKGERIIWISDRRDSRGIALPHHHIFAVRQEDGTHRFFGSHEPEKI